MSSPFLEGGGRRRRRSLRLHAGGTRRPPFRRRRRIWPATLAALVFIALAGAAAWFFGLRPNVHHPPSGVIALPRGSNLAPGPKSSPRPPGPPGIVLKVDGRLDPHFKDAPRAGMLFDLKSGQTLWSAHPLERLPIASLTKILTAIIVVERTGPHDLAPVTREALDYRGQALGLLPPHKRVPVEALLAGVLLTSASDAAITLADHIAGSDAQFARLMNEHAARFGLGCSHFVSAYGLQTQNQSCAADLAALARIAMHKSRIKALSGEVQARAPFPIHGGYLYVTSTNPLLRAHYPGTIGLKTGFTDAAGRCLVAIVRRHGRTLGVVLLHSPDPAAQAQRLFDAAFSRH